MQGSRLLHGSSRPTNPAGEPALCSAGVTTLAGVLPSLSGLPVAVLVRPFNTPGSEQPLSALTNTTTGNFSVEWPIPTDAQGCGASALAPQLLLLRCPQQAAAQLALTSLPSLRARTPDVCG